MKRFNCLIKITGCFILLVSMVSSITSCEDNSGSTYPGSNKYINGKGDSIYGEWAVTETRDDGLVIALIRYARNDSKKVQWITSVLIKDDAYSDLKMLRDRNFTANWVNTSIFFKKDEFIGLELGKEHDFKVQREAGTIAFHGKVTGTRGSGEFEYTPNQTFMDYIREKGYKSSPGDKGINLFISNINKKYFDDLLALGFDQWPMDKISEFFTHGVSPSFIKDIFALGYKDISASKLVEFRIHGVSPQFIREIQQAGLRDISPNKLVEFRIHGVSPQFIREIHQAGLKDISPNKLVEFRIHGVSPGFIREIQQSGHKNVTPDKLIEFRIHGVNSQRMKEYTYAENEDISSTKGMNIINSGSLAVKGQVLQLSTSDREISMLLKGWQLMTSYLIHTDDRIQLHFNSMGDKAKALLLVLPHSGTLPDSQDKSRDILKQRYKNHKIRPESWMYGEIDGLPSSTYIADYDNKGKKMIEYCTYIKNKQYLGSFELHVEKKAFNKVKTGFDSMVQSFKWKNK